MGQDTQIEWNGLTPSWKKILYAHSVFAAKGITYELIKEKYKNNDYVFIYKDLFNEEPVEPAESPRLDNIHFLWLNLLKKEITDLQPVQHLKNLKQFFLWWSSITDLTPLAGLKDMEEVVIVSGEIKDISPLARLARLKIFQANAQEKLSNIESLASCTELEVVDLKGTAVKNIKPIGKLSKLRSFSIEQTGVTNISALSNLSQLAEFNVKGTKISNENLKTFAETHPGCTIHGFATSTSDQSIGSLINYKPYKISASLTLLKDEDVHVLMFSDEIDNQKYFHIQNNVKNADPYIELNSQLFGTYKGVESVTRHAKQVLISLNDVGKNMLKHSSIEINLVRSDISEKELNSHLKKIFGTKFKQS